MGWAEFSPSVLHSLAPAGTWRARAVEPIGGREKQPDIDRRAGSPRENRSSFYIRGAGRDCPRGWTFDFRSFSSAKREC